MSIEIFESKNAVDLSRVEMVEDQLGAPLPQAYREFLLEHNGGYPEPDSFPFVRDDGLRYGMVDRFFAIHDGEHNNLLNYLRIYKDRIPSNMVPIARTPGGNLICISITGENVGKVYYWDHDEEVEDGEIPDYRNIYLVAKDFKEFLDSFQDIEASAA